MVTEVLKVDISNYCYEDDDAAKYFEVAMLVFLLLFVQVALKAVNFHPLRTLKCTIPFLNILELCQTDGKLTRNSETLKLNL